MRPLLLAALLALAPAALADSPTARFRGLLAQAGDPGPRAGLMIVFGDLSAARALDPRAVAGAAADPAHAQLRGFPNGNLFATLRDPARDWRAAVGFGPGDVDRLLELAAPPFRAQILTLAPGALPAIPPALAALGYAEVKTGGLRAWAWGEDDALDLGARNPDNPFGGMLGMGSRIQVDGALLRHATSWAALAALGAAPVLADRAALAALVDALDHLAPEGALTQAVIFPEAAMLGLDDPAALLGRAAPGATPPAWRAALLADFAAGPVSTGVLALTAVLPDEAAAQALAAHAARAWDARPVPSRERSFADLTGGPAEVTLHRATPDLWVLLIAQTGPTETYGRGITRNRAYTALFEGALRRELVFLQP